MRFKHCLILLVIASTIFALPLGIPIGSTTKMLTNEIFAQSEDLGTHSSELNKSSNKTLIRNNLASSLLFRTQSVINSSFSDAASNTSSARSSAVASSTSPISSATNEVKGDFNGDGFNDLAIGVPFEDVLTDSGTLETAGLSILYTDLQPVCPLLYSDQTNFGRKIPQV